MWLFFCILNFSFLGTTKASLRPCCFLYIFLAITPSLKSWLVIPFRGFILIARSFRFDVSIRFCLLDLVNCQIFCICFKI